MKRKLLSRPTDQLWDRKEQWQLSLNKITFQKCEATFQHILRIWEAHMKKLKEGGAPVPFPAGAQGPAGPARHFHTVGHAAVFKDSVISPSNRSTWTLRNTGGSSPPPNTVSRSPPRVTHHFLLLDGLNGHLILPRMLSEVRLKT